MGPPTRLAFGRTFLTSWHAPHEENRTPRRHVSCFARADEICVYTAHKNGTNRRLLRRSKIWPKAKDLPPRSMQSKRRIYMRTKRGLYLGVAAVAIALAFGVAATPASAQQNAAAVSIGNTDIGGVVTGPKG